MVDYVQGTLKQWLTRFNLLKCIWFVISDMYKEGCFGTMRRLLRNYKAGHVPAKSRDLAYQGAML